MPRCDTPLGLYPEPEPPDIGLIGFVHESEYQEIRDYGGYGWTTLPFDAPMWAALRDAGIIAALSRSACGEYMPDQTITVLDRLIPGLHGETRAFAEKFRDLARAAAASGGNLDIVLFRDGSASRWRAVRSFLCKIWSGLGRR